MRGMLGRPVTSSVKTFRMPATLLKSASIAALGTAVVCAVIGVAWSLDYWNYAFNPPSFARWVESVARIDAYEEFGPPWRDGSRPAAHLRGSRALVASSKLYQDYGTDFEIGNLAFELKRQRRFPASENAVGVELFRAVCEELRSAGQLYDGEPGYPNARRLYGALALGRNRAGEEVLLAAVAGSEASNDHYPRYQALFAVRGTKLNLVKSRRYFIDIAGIEGAKWWHISAALAIISIPICVSATLAVSLVSLRRKRQDHQRLPHSA
jgi:hypothetical protein